MNWENIYKFYSWETGILKSDDDVSTDHKRHLHSPFANLPLPNQAIPLYLRHSHYSYELDTDIHKLIIITAFFFCDILCLTWFKSEILFWTWKFKYPVLEVQALITAFLDYTISLIYRDIYVQVLLWGQSSIPTPLWEGSRWYTDMQQQLLFYPLLGVATQQILLNRYYFYKFNNE